MDITCTIDGFGPLPVLHPTSVAELGDHVRTAGAEGHALYPIGGKTLLGLGLPPTKPGSALDLRGLNQVIDYPARDMTITVQAGITIQRLQSILQAEGQWLPVDVPCPERATLGGAIATNASGPRRCGHGTLRDYVIGITVVNDEGQEVKGGGRVVKNVAGYDLMKLYTGSLGTLGIITQVTLKVKPLPERTDLLVVLSSADELDPVLDQLHASRTRPVCIDVLSPDAAPAAGLGELPPEQWLVVVGFEGTARAVGWQTAQLRKELPGGTAASVCSRPDALLDELRDFAVRPPERFSIKVNLLPSAVAGFCKEAAALSPRLLLQAHGGNGIVVIHAPPDLTREQSSAMLTTLAPLATAAQGNLIVTRCPSEWKADLPIWGRATRDRALMRAVKERLDPRGTFNPGRFVDGI